ncbi:MAG: hypothetical protein K2X87_03615 [Gemmataceae bacterium]|nr:hypothetical protein [Gemmataceae bacterium]
MSPDPTPRGPHDLQFRRLVDGIWHQLGAYISRHADARFSHGICPGCFEPVVRPRLDELGPRPQG